MSKPVNFLDLIKNPDKIQNKNQPSRPSQTSDSKLKQATIPPNLGGAQKNEWLEKQKNDQQSSENKMNNNPNQVRNPYQGNQNMNLNQRQSEQQSHQQPQQQNNLNNSNKVDYNQNNIQRLQQQPQQKQSFGRLNEDQVNNRFSANQQNQREANLQQNQQSNQDYSKKPSIQQMNMSIDKNNNIQQQRNIAQTNKIDEPILNKKSGVLSSTHQNKGVYSRQELLKAKYSLQQQQESKQDYMKLFSQIVKEYSNDENRYFDANKTILSIKFLYICIAILLIMVFFDVQASQTPRFCSKGEDRPSNSYCKPCPENAECKNYVMKCKNGYIQKGYECVIDPKLISNSKSFIIDRIEKMQYENGYHLCFDQDSSSDKVQQINIDKLIGELQSKHKPLDAQKKLLQQFANNKDNQQNYDFEYDGHTLSTSRVRFTLVCRCKYLIKTNFRAIIISSVALIILIILGFYIKHKIKQMMIADEIYTELISQLQQSSDKQINISYYKEGIVNRYKSDFNEDVWVLVDRKRFSEGKINVFRDYDGIYWSYI